MTPERWQRIEQLYHSALERDTNERMAFLAEACAGDFTLRGEVESLLRYDARAEYFVEAPALEVAAQLRAEEQAQSMIGRQLGHYQILSLLGVGGMGEVYLAKDTKLARKVALKLLPAEVTQDTGRLRRFIREARAASALNHPNIITIHEVSEADGAHFIVTEFIDGQTLRRRMVGDRLKLNQTLDIATQIAAALAAAHEVGIIHRDIKPENVMVRRDGLVKVLDFGLAKLTEGAGVRVESEAVTLKKAGTAPGIVMGTPQYMSPEQARGEELDARTDLFSFGTILYEMATGEQPFRGDSLAVIFDAILNREPAPLRQMDGSLPAELEQIIGKALEKNRKARHQTAAEMLTALKDFKHQCEIDSALKRTGHSHSGSRGKAANDLEKEGSSFRLHQDSVGSSKALWRVINRSRIAWAVAPVLLVALGLGYWLYNRNVKIRWAREQALPEINRLINEDQYRAAFALARKAEKYIPRDQALSQLWPKMSRDIAITTTPAGADISVREYEAIDREWEYLGKSPIARARLPFGSFRWMVKKAGYGAIERALYITSQGGGAPVSIGLEKDGDIPADMVRVPRGRYREALDAMILEGIQIEDYLIDKYEVTNRQFQEFIAAGGYKKREYWKHSFTKDGRALTWEEAMAQFRDATGRPGPATWELGNYPHGQDDFPVTGVSWYEAAAYAEFAGKSLPSVHYWAYATRPIWLLAIRMIPLSNFGGRGPARVGTHQGISPYGVYDMAGNVREWCWNESQRGRYIMGGGWNDPGYMFVAPNSLPPFDRSPTNGFRCVRYLGEKGIQELPGRPIEVQLRDYSKERAVSDDIFRVYAGLYAYDPTELNAVVEKVDESAEDWKMEKITFNAAYGNERMMAYLYLPKKATPPFQTVIYFPGTDALYQQRTGAERGRSIDFVMLSGRAALFPVYKSTYERADGYELIPPYTTIAVRDHAIQWMNDLRRSLDYLESRNDIAHDKLGYYGVSLGALAGPNTMALEKRLKVGVLQAGGLTLYQTRPEFAGINFAPRVTVPVLMVNGRDDFLYPVELSQKPLFRLLGSPEKDKRHVILEGGHNMPRNQTIKEILDWLDRYLGPTK